MEFTKEELKALHDALNEFVLQGFAEDDSDPIVTALMKVEEEMKGNLL